ncbi:MAG: hypothetical protein HPZ00_08215 [Christensenellaceae bacterium]|nr:hypothetical protein [Christensenellaceae bacterium]
MNETAKWYRLDNAAKLYPSIKTSRWSSVYRLSISLAEPVDKNLLEQAAAIAVKRTPAFNLRIKRGLFWFYFEQNGNEPIIYEDVLYPCANIQPRLNNGFLFKLRYYQNRIALEVFHSLADGSGGMSFLKTVTAQYLELKYNIKIPACCGVLDANAPPDAEEMEDAYKKYANLSRRRSRKEDAAFQCGGEALPAGCLNIITAHMPLEALINQAKKYKCSLTEYLVSVYIWAIYGIQCSMHRRQYKPVKISVPVNMRRFYPSRTLRNFSLFVNPGIDPGLGEYTFEEVTRQVHYFMRYEINAKALNAQMAANVGSERNPAVRIMPLFIKKFALGMVYKMAGESRFSGTLSNLGEIEFPEEMKKYITDAAFILGRGRVNSTAAAMLSYNKNVVLTFSRSVQNAEVERRFFTFLIKNGVQVKIESNNPEEEQDNVLLR